MNPYVERFTLTYTVLSILVAVIVGTLALKFGAGLMIDAMLASSIFAAVVFVKDHARAPTAKEKHAFA